MRKIILFIFIFFVALPCYASGLIGNVKITKVSDGDTFTIKLPETYAKVRLIGIDCYETSKIHRAYRQAYEHDLSIEEVVSRGKKAKSFMQKAIAKDESFKLQVLGVDRYARLLVVLYDSNGNKINDTLINNGLCYEYMK